MTFIINRWVRGKDFHGRTQVLADIHARKGKPTWILGNRRSGKTSLLRQMDWLCREGIWSDCTALYWDLQGAGNIEGLKDSFLECLEDAPEVAEKLDLDIDDLEDLGFPEIVNKFRRKVKSYKDGYLLLMIDECEELVDISAASPQVLGAFRKLSGHIPHLGLILAGSLRLLDLDESTSRTSPLLPDFLPPLMLQPFQHDEAVALLTQGGLNESAAQQIFNLTFGNPHLTQIMGEYWLRLNNHDAVIHELKHNQICQFYFDSNFNCLPADLNDAYKKGSIFATLKTLTPETRHFAYACQSALLRKTDDGIEISPLLHLHIDGILPSQRQVHATPLAVAMVAPAQTPVSVAQETETSNSAAPPEPAPQTKPAPTAAKQRVAWQETWDKLCAYLQQHPSGVLPPVALKSSDPRDWADFRTPPSLNLLPLLGHEQDDEAKKKEILRHAAPEFVDDRPATAATAVYLAGLFLHYKLLGHLPLDHKESVAAMAHCLSAEEVAFDLQAWPSPLDRRLAIVLKRALKRSPDGRYASLATLQQDLQAMLF